MKRTPFFTALLPLLFSLFTSPALAGDASPSALIKQTSKILESTNLERRDFPTDLRAAAGLLVIPRVEEFGANGLVLLKDKKDRWYGPGFIGLFHIDRDDLNGKSLLIPLNNGGAANLKSDADVTRELDGQLGYVVNGSQISGPENLGTMTIDHSNLLTADYHGDFLSLSEALSRPVQGSAASLTRQLEKLMYPGIKVQVIQVDSSMKDFFHVLDLLRGQNDEDRDFEAEFWDFTH